MFGIYTRLKTMVKRVVKSGPVQAWRDPNFIDVRTLLKELTVEELCDTAENYFARINDPEYQLAKPFGSITECPELLMCLAQVLHGLRPAPGMTVLDFGAGTCWTSRFLTQLGCRVIAMDVSPSALKIGKQLFERQPVIGDRPKPQFMVFDGHRMDLPNASVDRILCYDMFHHVPNPDQVLAEMGRVLNDGGIAGFSEPGPDHSKMPQSQAEMRNHKVIENDIDIRAIWDAASRSGFSDIQLAVCNGKPFHLSLDDFESYMNGDRGVGKFAHDTRQYMESHRIFFLYKGVPAKRDSRLRDGLMAELKVEFETTTLREGSPLTAQVSVTNTGEALWLPKSAEFGAVQLGGHLYDASGKLLELDYDRHALTPGEGKPVAPGETLNFKIEIPCPPKGKYILEYDLVSEKLIWFSMNGSKTVRVAVEVK